MCLQGEDIVLCEAMQLRLQQPAYLAASADIMPAVLLFSHCCLQEEDIALCEAVQLGLQEPAYGVGRYAPGPEAPMYHFHSLLYGAVMRGMQEQQ